MRLRKTLAFVLALIMIISGIPTVAFAEEADSTTGLETNADSSGNLFLDKTATLTDDGTYTINLEAYATGTPIITSIKEGVPLDVVLVIDQSGSLYAGPIGDLGEPLDALKESVNSFIDSLKINGEAFGVNHRVSICGFASGPKQGASGIADYGLTYANDTQDNAWVNTGLFVDGEFKDYGTVEYTLVESADEISTNYYYAIQMDMDGDGIIELVRAYYSGNAWNISSLKAYGAGDVIKVGVATDTETASENLFNNYKVYAIGESKNLLTDADYAASWENVAGGENGQGNVNSDITNAIDHLAANGSTATFYGLKMAKKMLENAPDDGVERKKVVIVFTDGEPGFNNFTQADADAALSEAKLIKEAGAEIYAVGIYTETSATRVETFMNKLSSNYSSHSYTTEPTYLDMSKASASSSNTYMKYTSNIDGNFYTHTPYFYKVGENYWPIVVYYNPKISYDCYVSYVTDESEVFIAYGSLEELETSVGDVYMLDEGTPNEDTSIDYYMYASDYTDLAAMFKTVTTNATTFTSEIALGADAVMKDVMGTSFVLTDNTTITVSVVPGSVSDEYSDLSPEQLTADKITWGEAQTVFTMTYPEETEKTGNVIVTGSADAEEMTLKATASSDGVVTVTGFNYANPADEDKINAQYICAGHAGAKLVVTITGVEALPDTITNDFTATNNGISGIYEPEDSDTDEDGVFGEVQASFEIPTTYLTSKSYVMDYAKPLTIDPNDFYMTLGAVNLDVDGYNYFAPAVTSVTEDYGGVALNEGQITYSPSNTNWDGFDTFYVFGATENTTVTSATANANGNLWSKVNVIPANNVYYEDTFVTSEEVGTAGIVYTGVWSEDGTAGNQNENAESGETADTGDAENQGGVHGWEDTLADDTGYSDGSAHVSSTTGATATFTFTGTGVDIYSRTNNTTGIVVAMLYEGESTTDADGANLVAKYTLMVDNLSASGDYYQVPTLSLCQIPVKDDNGNTVMTDLPHGTYTVKIIVSKASDYQTGSERFTYYLDGIRVYNPIQDKEGNPTVSEAYGEEELNAMFVEIRDKLLDANSFNAEDEESEGVVFIDRITSETGDHTDNTETTEIGVYEVFGPENEVYLSAGQMVGFAVDYQEGAHYYIGLKSLTGENADIVINSVNDTLTTVGINHTTDLYYEVIPAWQTDADGNKTVGYVVISAYAANGEIVVGEDGESDYVGSILALTKLKVTGPAATTFSFARVRNSDLLNYAQQVAEADPPEAEIPGGDEEIGEDITTEGTGDGEPDVEDTETSTEPNTPDIEIDNPDEEDPSENEPTEQEKIWEAIKRLFDSLHRWFKR